MSNGSENSHDEKDIEFYNSRVRKFGEFLKSKDLLPFSCQFCKQKSLFTLLGFKADITVIPTNNLGQYYPAYHLSCQNCGYIHAFSATVVDKA